MSDEKPLSESVDRLIGKTIAAVDASCVNNIVLRFTDGTRLALHIETDHMGLPDVQTCTSCV